MRHANISEKKPLILFRKCVALHVCVYVHACMHACVRACVRVYVCMYVCMWPEWEWLFAEQLCT